MTIRTMTNWFKMLRLAIAISVSLGWLSISGERALAQRVLGVDISYWNSAASQANWNTAYNTPNANGFTRQFAFIRATRGGTTGVDQPQGTPGGGTLATLSHRYDDPNFVQNINRATTAGMLAGPYHFGRPDIAGNTGTDEADHFIQMAGTWMRPGYLMPVYDMEAGSGSDTLAQFAIDFSNRIYSVMQIRPSIYINGNYSSILQGATSSRRDQLAKPATYTPSVAGPAYPMLWDARWPNQTDPESIPVQTGNPKDTGGTLTSYYGPWDDYGNTAPWSVWQYASTVSIPGLNAVDSSDDGDVSHGDIEYMRDYLVPAVWWNDSSGDWSTLANWNSGQTPTVPVTPSDQATPLATGPLPTARSPGAAGSGPTSGQYDTVILERPNANIAVTLSSGTYNIRKMYMREALNITGGTLTINYDPNYNFNVGVTDSLRSGPISAQFSGPVTLSGTGSLSVNTLQVDASQTFTLAGSSGTLTFKQINLLSSAKIAVTGDVNINPLSNATATISGSSGSVDLNAGVRTFNVGNGTADVDLDVVSPITNGGLIKNGAGTMRLSGNNTFGLAVTVNAGVLRYNHSSGLQNTQLVTVNNGGTLDMNNITDSIFGLASAAGNTTGVVLQGTAGLTLTPLSGTVTFGGTITGTGAFTKNGFGTQILSGNNSLGPVAVNVGSLLFNGTNTTGAVTVASGATLGGTGSVTGTVMVNSGGHIAPGASIESLGVGSLTLNTGSVLDIELAAPGTSDLINVSGLLTLGGGSVNLIDLGGVNAGTYTLINYGTLSGSVANLGAPTGGPSNFNYNLVDTGSAINLSVTIPGDFNVDGTVDAADYVVWNKGLGTTYTSGDYDVWRANFGRSAGSGSGSSFSGATSIPEPATIALVGTALAMLHFRQRRVDQR
jgi:autotransporter-associated beta strand protein